MQIGEPLADATAMIEQVQKLVAIATRLIEGLTCIPGCSTNMPCQCCRIRSHWRAALAAAEERLT